VTEQQPDWVGDAPPPSESAEALAQLPTRPTPRGQREQYSRSRWGTLEETIVRQNRALELKMAGATHTQIAEVLGYNSRNAVSLAIERALERDTSRVGSARDEFRRITVARTERLIRGLWNNAIRGDLAAVDRVVKIMERQAKLLGLDAPTQVTITDETKSELSRLIGDVEKILVPGEVVGMAAAEEVSSEQSDTEPGAASGGRAAGRHPPEIGGGDAGGAGSDPPDWRDWGLAAEGAEGELGALPVAGAAERDPDDGDVADDGRPGDGQDRGR
jgi:hypothetical protein